MKLIHLSISILLLTAAALGADTSKKNDPRKNSDAVQNTTSSQSQQKAAPPQQPQHIFHEVVITVSNRGDGVKTIVITLDGRRLAGNEMTRSNEVSFYIADIQKWHTQGGWANPRWRNALDDPAPHKVRVDRLLPPTTGGNFTFFSDEHVDWASDIVNSGATVRSVPEDWKHLPNGDTEEWTFKVVDTYK